MGIPGQEELGTADSLRRVGPSLLLSPVAWDEFCRSRWVIVSLDLTFLSCLVTSSWNQRGSGDWRTCTGSRGHPLPKNWWMNPCWCGVKTFFQGSFDLLAWTKSVYGGHSCPRFKIHKVQEGERPDRTLWWPGIEHLWKFYMSHGPSENFATSHTLRLAIQTRKTYS